MLRLVDLHPSEDVLSFLSRLAAANGVQTLRGLLRQIDVSYQGLLSGDARAITKIVQLLPSVNEEDIWDACYLRNEKSRPGVIRGHRLQGVLGGKQTRYCAACILEDQREGKSDWRFRPYRRLSWLVPEINSCHKHKVLLSTPLLTPPKGSENEFQNIISMSLGVVRAQAEKSKPSNVSAFEDYCARRYDGLTSGNAWLDEMPVDVVRNLALHIGTLILYQPNHGPTKNEVEARIEASNTGFDILHAGEAALRSTLLARAEKIWHQTGKWNRPGPHSASMLLGSLLRLLEKDKEERYTSVYQVVREVGLEYLPLGPGDRLLGPVKERRFHTFQSLSSALKISPSRLRTVLEEDGILQVGGSLAHVPISALPMDKLRCESSRIGRVQFLHEYGLRDLQETIIFDPKWTHSLHGIDTPSVRRKRFVSVQADALLSLLTAKAVSPPQDAASRKRFVRMQQAAELTGCSVNEVIEMLAEGRLEQVVFYHDSRFGGIHVSPDELQQKLERPDNTDDN